MIDDPAFACAFWPSHGRSSSETTAIIKEKVPDAFFPQDRAFWGMTVTQFLGAFNDNLFKQLVLLLSVVGVAASSSDPSAQDLQWVAMVVFALSFVLFSGLAGFLSDRNGKRTVIVLSKVAEIAVMSLGMAAFAGYAYAGLTGSLAVLFLMGEVQDTQILNVGMRELQNRNSLR